MKYKFGARSVVFLVTGVLCLVFGLVLVPYDPGYREIRQVYGGDAFTGIQNAAAQTARNVYYLNLILKNGFTFAFIVAGLGFIGASIPPSFKEDSIAKAEEVNPTENDGKVKTTEQEIKSEP